MIEIFYSYGNFGRGPTIDIIVPFRSDTFDKSLITPIERSGTSTLSYTDF